MERESFEDEETARILKNDFIAIKVDREERPDVDRVYVGALLPSNPIIELIIAISCSQMSYVQAISGHGGWPMSVFLTPDLKPFFGGTYFPKEARYGMTSFKNLLKNVADTWKDKQNLVVEQV